MSVMQCPEVRAASTEVHDRLRDLDALLQQSGTPGWETRMDAAQTAYHSAWQACDSAVLHAELDEAVGGG